MGTDQVLVTIGDLVEDVVVHLGGPLNVASDTPAIVRRRRGGSAANMASTAARVGHRVRFVGQVGDDAIGASVVDALVADGVEAVVRRDGRTGTVICLVDATGERSMLADRASCVDLAPHDEAWLDEAHTLHVPFYSLSTGPLAATTETLVEAAHRRGVRVSIDLSSVGVMAAYGRDAVIALLRRLGPDVVFANDDEAAFLGEAGWPAALGTTMVVVKHGPAPAEVRDGDGTATVVPVPPLGEIDDTTGAGDAFAAGFLVSWAEGTTASEAAAAGHRSAAQVLTGPR